jgi:lysophospholipase L1-like esterase
VDKLESRQPTYVVVYGTSLSVENCAFWRRPGGAWVTYLRNELSGKYPGIINVVNAAKWGSDSEWGLRKLGSRLLRYDFDVVFVEFSVNDADIRRNISLVKSYENLVTIVQDIRTYKGVCDIVVMTMNPAFGRHLKVRPRLDDYYQICRDVARDQDLLLVDHFTYWQQLLDLKSEVKRYFSDDIHPNALACEQVILPRVLQTLQIPSSPATKLSRKATTR